MSNDQSNFALIMWIKKDQAERAEHRAKMVMKNHKDDAEFMSLIKPMVPAWSKLKVGERTFVMNMVRHRDEGRNLSPAQRSELTRIWLKCK